MYWRAGSNVMYVDLQHKRVDSEEWIAKSGFRELDCKRCIVPSGPVIKPQASAQFHDTSPPSAAVLWHALRSFRGDSATGLVGSYTSTLQNLRFYLLSYTLRASILYGITK